MCSALAAEYLLPVDEVLNKLANVVRPTVLVVDVVCTQTQQFRWRQCGERLLSVQHKITRNTSFVSTLFQTSAQRLENCFWHCPKQ